MERHLLLATEERDRLSKQLTNAEDDLRDASRMLEESKKREVDLIGMLDVQLTKGNSQSTKPTEVRNRLDSLRAEVEDSRLKLMSDGGRPKVAVVDLDDVRNAISSRTFDLIREARENSPARLIKLEEIRELQEQMDRIAFKTDDKGNLTKERQELNAEERRAAISLSDEIGALKSQTKVATGVRISGVDFRKRAIDLVLDECGNEYSLIVDIGFGSRERVLHISSDFTLLDITPRIMALVDEATSDSDLFLYPSNVE